MLKLCAVMAAVLICASVAMAGLTFQINADTSGSNLIQDLAGGPVVATPSGYNASFVRGYHYYDFDGNDQVVDIFRVILTVTDLDLLAPWRIGVLGMGLQITGDGASHLTPLPEAMWLPINQLKAEFNALGFAFPFTASNPTNSLFDGVKETFAWTADNSSYSKIIAPGSAVGEFIYAWDGHQGGSVTLHVVGDWDFDYPQLQAWDSRMLPDSPLYENPQFGTVSNNDLVVPLPVPEPATLSLLGLGLAGLFSRRRK